MSVSFKPKRLLTVPVLSLKDNEPRILRFDGKMHIGKTMKAKEGDKPKEPATIASVTDMESGEIFDLIVSAVLHSVLDEEFPGDAYVGKVFSVTALPKRDGKQYKGMKVYEMDIVDSSKPAEEASKAKK
jgi:hypothetical protein